MTFQEACDKASNPKFGQTVLKNMKKVLSETGIKPTVRIGQRGKGDWPFHLIQYVKDGETASLSYFGRNDPTVPHSTINEKDWGPPSSYDEVKDYVDHEILGFPRE